MTIETIPASYEECKTKVAKKSFIKHKLETDDRWLVRGLLAIYAKQTEDEKMSDATKASNDVGFNAMDANILSDISKRTINAGAKSAAAKPDFNVFRFLSARQRDLVRKKMIKYAGQLVYLIDNKLV